MCSNSNIIDYLNVSSWPKDIIKCFDNNIENCKGWQCSCCERSSPFKYNNAVRELRLLLRQYSLIGYHCTKLTEDEIKIIQKNGLSLQNLSSLRNRIDELASKGLIINKIANRLKSENQSDETNRANMIWFCFFKPYEAGQNGIGRFFNSWGVKLFIILMNMTKKQGMY